MDDVVEKFIDLACTDPSKISNYISGLTREVVDEIYRVTFNDTRIGKDIINMLYRRSSYCNGPIWSNGTNNRIVTIQVVIEHLDSTNVPVLDIPIDKVKPIIIDQDYDGGAKWRVDNADLDYPIIILTNSTRYRAILDGNHRAYKAVITNQKTIKARLLDLNASTTPEYFRELFTYNINARFA